MAELNLFQRMNLQRTSTSHSPRTRQVSAEKGATAFSQALHLQQGHLTASPGGKLLPSGHPLPDIGGVKDAGGRNLPHLETDEIRMQRERYRDELEINTALMPAAYVEFDQLSLQGKRESGSISTHLGRFLPQPLPESYAMPAADGQVGSSQGESSLLQFAQQQGIAAEIANRVLRQTRPEADPLSASTAEGSGASEVVRRLQDADLLQIRHYDRPVDQVRETVISSDGVTQEAMSTSYFLQQRRQLLYAQPPRELAAVEVHEPSAVAFDGTMLRWLERKSAKSVAEPVGSRPSAVSEWAAPLPMEAVAEPGELDSSPRELAQLLKDNTAAMNSAQQFQRHLMQRVQEMLQEGQWEAEMTLAPERLGMIRIKMIFEDSQLQAQFASQNADVRELLEVSLPRLKELLSEGGVDLAAATVGDDSGQQRDPSGQSPTTAFALNRRNVDSDPESLSETETSLPSHDGELDTFV